MIQVRLPSGKLVPVNTDDPKIAAATARAFVAKDPYERARAQAATSPGVANASGAAETFIRGVPFLSEAQAGMAVPVDMARDALMGHPVSAGKSWQKERALQQGWVDNLKAAHPVAANLTTGAAMATPIAAAILTGGASAAPEIEAAAPGVAKGVAGLLKPVLARTARRATVGAATGYAAGASQPGTLAERAQGGDTGAALGAATGAVLLPAAGAVAKGVSKVAKTVAKTTTRAVNKAASLSGNDFLDPTRVAMQRLSESLKADGATAADLKAAQNAFLKNGATAPTLLDIASRLPSGGANTRALIRGSAMGDSARGVATTHNDMVAGNLQDRALATTRGLTPDTRPASVVQAAAEDARGKAADVEYRAPYATPVDAAPVLPALDGDAGRVAMTAAHKDADALRLGDQMSELQKLRAAAGPEEIPTASIAGEQIPASQALADKIKAATGAQSDSVPVSLGTLDRVKIALNDAGQAAARGGENSRAAGYFQRAAEIDDHLAGENPDYAAARDNYARRSAGIDAIDHGQTGLDGAPDDYAATLDDLTAKGGADAEANAGIGYRQRLTDAIAHPAEGSTGVLNRIGTANDQTANLSATYGPDVAERYQSGLRDLIDQLRNARYVNPDSGSASAGRAVDAGLVDPDSLHAPRLNPVSLVMAAINKVNRGATLTQAEREAIARVSLTPMGPDVATFDVNQPKPVHSALLDDMRSYIAGLTPETQRENSQ